jgi:frataxin-like iron-binding protein CyaY
MNQPIRLSSKIDAGVKAAITQAIEKHRKLGQSISIWRDGKVVTLTAEQISPIVINNCVTTNR